jgi:predicted nucleotidyltransferase
MSAIDTIQEILKQDERINSAFLHGSFGTAQQTEKSDLDIAVLMKDGEKLSASDRLELVTKLEENFTRIVDLGVLSAEALVYAVQAIGKGKILFIKNQYQHDLKIATLLAQYAQLKEDRVEVERAYAI